MPRPRIPRTAPIGPRSSRLPLLAVAIGLALAMLLPAHARAQAGAFDPRNETRVGIVAAGGVILWRQSREHEPQRFGGGLRIGHTFEQPLYVGGSALAFLGSTSAASGVEVRYTRMLLTLDVGRDIDFGLGLLLRPIFGMGVSRDHARSRDGGFSSDVELGLAMTGGLELVLDVREHAYFGVTLRAALVLRFRDYSVLRESNARRTDLSAQGDVVFGVRF